MNLNTRNLLNQINSGAGITHPGTFHADDVLSACLIRLINPNFKIIRSNVIQNDFKGVVFDIGLGRYDHHQMNAEIRDSGIKYAAFGLLWRDLYSLFMDKYHAEMFDKVFVSEIDRCDNSSDTNLLSNVIGNFNPSWNGNENSNENFELAVKTFTPLLSDLIHHFKHSTFAFHHCYEIDDYIKAALLNIYQQKTNRKLDISRFVPAIEVWKNHSHELIPEKEPEYFERIFLNQISKVYGKYKTSPFILMFASTTKEIAIPCLEEIIRQEIKMINAIEPAKRKCEEIYQNSKRKDIIVLDRYIPYSSMTEQHEEIKMVIFPSDRNGYAMFAAAMNINEKKSNHLNPKKSYPRIEFPMNLRGKSEEELRSYHPGLFFVHPSGHMASCDSIKDCIELYQKIEKINMNLT